MQPFLSVSNGRWGRRRNRRQAIDGILHRVRTEVHWRDLPERSRTRKTGRRRRKRPRPATAYTDAPFTGGSEPDRTTATPRYACWWRRRQWDQSSRWAVLWTGQPSHRAGAGSVSRGRS
ncbi:hypothetical protein [Streptomyces sp. NPDC017964]|uniref:hypothetical protein n=1 Tax=Streptomyces sp. NPDC017964 TaxID=3365022 RepID=UPI0037B80E7E